MYRCHVCGFSEAHQELVSEIFDLDGKPVLVENIPAQICDRCGEPTFSRQTTEKIRLMLHGGGAPVRTVRMDVFAYP